MPAAGGGQEGRVVVVRRLGDELLERDIPADGVSGVIEQGVRQGPNNTAVPVCKRMDGQQVQREQTDQKHRMVLALRDRFFVPVDELNGEVLGVGCRDRDESPWAAGTLVGEDCSSAGPSQYG
jgi:hypothetical protein